MGDCCQQERRHPHLHFRQASACAVAPGARLLRQGRRCRLDDDQGDRYRRPGSRHRYGGSKAKFVQFSTLPFLPKGIKFAERELEIATAGADMTTVKVRLPWVNKEGRPIAQQLWDTQAKAA